MYNEHMKSKSGFTIVELLIVIVVIGILASVTAVAFAGASERAADSAILTDLRDASTKMNRYRVEIGNWANTWPEVVPPGQFGGTAPPEYGIRVAKRTNYTNLAMCGFGRPASSPSYFGPSNSAGLIIVGTSAQSGKLFAIATDSGSPRDISATYDPLVTTDICLTAATAFNVKSGFQWNLHPYVGSNS